MCVCFDFDDFMKKRAKLLHLNRVELGAALLVSVFFNDEKLSFGSRKIHFFFWSQFKSELAWFGVFSDYQYLEVDRTLVFDIFFFRLLLHIQ